MRMTALIAAEPHIEDVVARPAGASTIVKTRFVSGGQQLLRLDDEAAPTSIQDSDAFADASVYLLSDYAKGVVSDALLASALNAAQTSGAPVVVDPKGRDFARYGAVDVIKPNGSELAGATGLPVGTDAEVETALAALLAAPSWAEEVVAASADDMFAPGTDVSRQSFAVRDDYTSLMWLGGTRAQPVLGGDARLLDFAADLPALGADYRGIILPRAWEIATALEPQVVVARWSEGGLELWAATQSPSRVAAGRAGAQDRPPRPRH